MSSSLPFGVDSTMTSAESTSVLGDITVLESSGVSEEVLDVDVGSLVEDMVLGGVRW